MSQPPPPIDVPTPAPLGQRGRIETLDLARGFAVLGILLINVWAYGLPFPAALNPRLVGYDTFVDEVVYGLVHMTAYMKTMPIFSMLFGAGIVLFSERLQARGVAPRRYFVRRQFWLLLFGLAHGYLLWDGDILAPYAVVGLILFPLRTRRPRTLLLLALIALLVPRVTSQVGGAYMQRMMVEAEEACVAREAGEALTESQEHALEMAERQGPQWHPTAEEIEEVREVRRGGYWAMVAHFAPDLAMMHLLMYPLMLGWTIGGFMLVGMWLLRSAILTGDRSTRFYALMAATAYGVGLPLAGMGLWLYHEHHADMLTLMRTGGTLVETAGPLVALGHIATVILCWKRGWLRGLQTRLAAAGRMAFTNYLSQTLICTTLFFGFGFGLFGRLHRLELLALAVLIWLAQLWWSPWWLRRFRMGPLEWIWRWLTYRRRPALRR